MNCLIELVNGVVLDSDPYSTATLKQLQEHLATQGLHVVTAADKAVLEAARVWGEARGEEQVLRAVLNLCTTLREQDK